MNPGALTALPVASPHAHGGNSVSRTMLRVQMALVPATFYGFWLFGWPAFFLMTTGAALPAMGIMVFLLRRLPPPAATPATAR